jgi:hypothetical protein
MSSVVVRVNFLLGLCAVSSAAASPCPPPEVTQQAAEIIDGKLAFCADPSTPCWVIDPATSAWTRQAMPSRASTTVTAGKVTACPAGGKDCVIVSGTFDESARAIASDDLARVAVWSGATVAIYDTKSGTQISTIAGWKSPMGPAKAAQFQQVRFVGPALAVWESWTPVSSAARLFDPASGKRIGDIGKAGAEIEPWAVSVGKDTWAFAGFDPKVYVVNVKNAKVVKTIKLSGGQSGRQMPGSLADGRIVIVTDGVTLVDVTTKKATSLSTPCHE